MAERRQQAGGVYGSGNLEAFESHIPRTFGNLTVDLPF